MLDFEFAMVLKKIDGFHGLKKFVCKMCFMNKIDDRII